jgi:transposase
MKVKRRKITSEFKAEIVIEALKERMTLADLASKYKVAGSQISIWKRDFIKNAALVFGNNKEISEEEAEKQKMFIKIGQLQLENDFLKKTLR